MTGAVVPFNHYADIRHVRMKDPGFRTLMALLADLDRYAPAHAEHYAAEMCRAYFITPAELELIWRMLEDERRWRGRAARVGGAMTPVPHPRRLDYLLNFFRPQRAPDYRGENLDGGPDAAA